MKRNWETDREMIADIVNNGAEYECSFKGVYTHSWVPYKLGDKIYHEYWEYRKVEKYIVFYNMNMELEIGLKSKHPNLKNFEFEGSKEECEKWVEEHTKKTWLKETFPIDTLCADVNFDNKKSRLGATETCKKILEMYEKMNEPSGFIKSLIEDLGVKV